MHIDLHSVTIQPLSLTPSSSASLLDTAVNRELTAAITRCYSMTSAPIQVSTLGKVVYADGAVYIGTIKAVIASGGAVSMGVPNGYGTTTKLNGSAYTGCYHNGVYHGYGEYTEVRDGIIKSQY
jgi:hypothetical protein